MPRSPQVPRLLPRAATSERRLTARNSRVAYGPDLALVHHAGFGQAARAAAEELITRLRAAGIKRGQVVDLGCGSGLLAHAVTEAGYDVLGYDISPAMLQIARGTAPRARFRRGSFIDAPLPQCIAITAIGEVVNYLFDDRNSLARLVAFFGRAYDALQPGGVLLFDAAAPGRAGPRGVTRGYTDDLNWTCLYTATEDRSRQTLTREIKTFCRVGRVYRLRAEVHRLQLYPRSAVSRELRAAGFQARSLRGYGAVPFPGWVPYLARKL